MKTVSVEGIKKQPVYFAFISTLLILAAVVTVVVVVSQDTRTYVSTTTVKGKVESRPLATSGTAPLISTTVPLPTILIHLKKSAENTSAETHSTLGASSSSPSPSFFPPVAFFDPPTTTTTLPPNITEISNVKATAKSETITTVRATVTSTKGSDFDFVYAFYFKVHANTAPQTARTKGSNSISDDVSIGICDSDSFFVVVTWPGGSLTSDSVKINTPLTASCNTTTTAPTSTTTAPPTTTTVPITLPTLIPGINLS